MHSGRGWGCFFASLVVAASAQAQPRTPIEQMPPNALELTQLPKYCWGPMGAPSVAQLPEYNISGCGPRMNHFCPALLAMMRASDVARPRQQRQFLARYAEREVQYTLTGIPAACPILPDIKRAESRAALLMSMLK